MLGHIEYPRYTTSIPDCVFINMAIYFQIKLFVCMLCWLKAPSFSCLDESGTPVDSWVALSQDEDYQYYFHHIDDGFTKSSHMLNQTTYGSIMSTVNQLYSSDLNSSSTGGTAYALYNDDPPTEVTPSSTFAHSKGMILTNSTHGFWMVHSKPNWPNPRGAGAVAFPDSTYAQSLMCVNFNISTINAIAAAQMINFPYIYDSFLASDLQTQLANFKSWVEGDKSSLTSDANVFASTGGVEYTHFAKSKNWGKGLYEDLVAPGLNSSLNVETWRLGSGGRMGSMCTGHEQEVYYNTLLHDVMEVSTVTMPDGASWTGTKDHSKWATTFDSNTHAVCISDINRMCSQENRGGGSLCATGQSDLWTSFDNAIGTDVGECGAINPCDGVGSQCYWCPEFIPTMPPTSAPENPVSTGDLAVIAFNSDNPDTFAMVVLKEIAAGNTIKVTDNGWDGTALRTTEGVLTYTAAASVPKGTVLRYNGVNMTDNYGTWVSDSGTFLLSASGDQLLVYTGQHTAPNFLYGFATTPWVASGEATSASTSVLPAGLAANTSSSGGAAHCEFHSGTPDNLMYSGPTNGTAAELLQLINTVSEWSLSNTVRFSVDDMANFVVFSDPSLAPTVAPTATVTATAAVEEIQTPGQLGDQEFLCDFIKTTNVNKLSSQWRCKRGVPATSPCGDGSAGPWAGLKCDEDNRIRAIHLHRIADSFGVIRGEIPASIGNLDRLVRLKGSHQNLRGDLPRELSDLNMLEILRLDGNSFTGRLPKGVGGLKHLRELDVSRNHLHGKVPRRFLQLCGVNRSTKIFLGGNDIDGIEAFKRACRTKG